MHAVRVEAPLLAQDRHEAGGLREQARGAAQPTDGGAPVDGDEELGRSSQPMPETTGRRGVVSRAGSPVRSSMHSTASAPRRWTEPVTAVTAS